MGLRRGCAEQPATATQSADSKPVPNQPAYAKTCPAELSKQWGGAAEVACLREYCATRLASQQQVCLVS